MLLIYLNVGKECLLKKEIKRRIASSYRVSMSVNLPYLNGVRTKYSRTLLKEVENGTGLMSIDYEILDEIEFKNFVKQVSECMKKIESYIEKVGEQSGKIAIALGEEDETFIQQILTENSEICDKALSIFFNLQDLDSSIKD